MKLKEALKMQKEASEKKLSIRIKKGHDYAKGEDCLTNFKEMAELAFIIKLDITKPQGVAMWHLLHKVVRIVNLWNKGVEPENESLEDSHNDLENYSELAKECYIDWVNEGRT